MPERQLLYRTQPTQWAPHTERPAKKCNLIILSRFISHSGFASQNSNAAGSVALVPCLVKLSTFSPFHQAAHNAADTHRQNWGCGWQFRDQYALQVTDQSRDQ